MWCPLFRPSLVALAELVVLVVDNVGLGWRFRTTCWFTTALKTDWPVERLSLPPPPPEPPPPWLEDVVVVT